MTDHEKAVKYARSVEWADANKERVREIARNWYRRNSFKANCSSFRYDQEHYQDRLAYFREYHRRRNDELRKKEYKPRHAARVPAYAKNAAHARSMAKDIQPMPINIAFANGIVNRNEGSC